MNKVIIIYLGLAFLIFGFFGWNYLRSGGKDIMGINNPYIEINNLYIPVQIADSKEKTLKGLSGRENLESQAGMLFVFDNPDFHRFWMKDMNFPIDIVWISDKREIIAIDKNISNEFDPQNPPVYVPPSPIRYALEVNSGFSEKNNLSVGDRVIFRKIK